MEVFEKHLEEDCPYVRPTSVDAEIMRQEWRAALERVLVQMNENRFMDNGELRTWIEEELEESDESD